MTLRVSDAYEKGDIELNTLQNGYLNIASGQSSYFGKRSWKWVFSGNKIASV